MPQLIAISIGNAPEQGELGFGEDHLTEALVRTARLLLRGDCRLAYGGDLRPGGFTELLMGLVHAENGIGGVGEESRKKRSSQLRRLVNFLPWPRYGGLTPDVLARYLGVARFVCVPPPGETEQETADVTRDARVRSALALSQMRRAMARGGLPDVNGDDVPGADARLVLGGKLFGYGGFMPGILEEAAWAAEPVAGVDAKALFVLGGFGGAAAALARGILEGAPIEAVTYEGQYEHTAHAALRTSIGELEGYLFKGHVAAFHPKQRYETLVELCKQGAAGLAKSNGLSVEQNERLLVSSDVTEVLGLLKRSTVLFDA